MDTLEILSEEQQQHYIDMLPDESAQEQLITHNMRLIYHILKKYGCRYDQDLFSVGCIGLIKGVRTFDKNAGIKLATYVTKCIQNSIFMEFRRRKKHLIDSVSLDLVVTETGEKPLYDIIASEEDITFNVMNEADKDTMYLLLGLTLASKSEKFIKAVELRLSGLRQDEIGPRLNLSQSYVCRILKKVTVDAEAVSKRYERRGEDAFPKSIFIMARGIAHRLRRSYLQSEKGDIISVPIPQTTKQPKPVEPKKEPKEEVKVPEQKVGVDVSHKSSDVSTLPDWMKAVVKEPLEEFTPSRQTWVRGQTKPILSFIKIGMSFNRPLMDLIGNYYGKVVVGVVDDIITIKLGVGKQLLRVRDKKYKTGMIVSKQMLNWLESKRVVFRNDYNEFYFDSQNKTLFIKIERKPLAK